MIKMLALQSMNGLVQPLETFETNLVCFLERFPEYRKTLRLAVVHEEAGLHSRSYQGWQWHDVETHPTKLIGLVTEGISRINLRTRHATAYLLRDRVAVKFALERLNDTTEQTQHLQSNPRYQRRFRLENPILSK